MKKTICLLLTALLLCALLGSCGKKTISEVDLTLTVGGTAVRPDTSVSALLDAFGTDYTYSEAVSCVYTGMDKTYAYSDRILYTYPDGDADRLLELDTAMGQYNRIAEAIQSLNILPERCALVESEPEHTQGLRQMLVDNYSVFYIVGEDAVSVARVLYSASDLVRRLRRMK